MNVQVDVEPQEGNNPTLEEQAAAMDAKAAETTQEATPSTVEGGEKILGKFESTEDLAKAYEELQSKLGQATETPTEEPTGEPTDGSELEIDNTPTTQNEVIQQASEEFWEKGEITEESYTKLSEMGLSKDIVDQFAEGMKAKQELSQYQAQQLQQQAFNQVGGEDNYKDMAAWAKDSLSDSELKAYNDNVNSGDQAKINFAVNGLYAQYSKNNSQPPQSQISGMNAPQGVTGFKNIQEQIQAQGDPRYKSDPNFREELMKRIAASAY